MKSKKGAELALNVVIIAVIGLLVLAVILYIFIGRSQTFSKTTELCESKQGKCIDSAQICAGPIVPAADCDTKEPKQKCCLKLV